MRKAILFAAAALAAFSIVSCQKDKEEELKDAVKVGGVVYKTVTMKDGSVWMAENLRFVPYGATICGDLNNIQGGIYFPIVAKDGAAAFSQDEAVITSNGLLYQIEAALGVPAGTIKTEEDAKKYEGAQGICPDGWHLPTIKDITSLVGKAVSPIETVSTAPYYDGSNGSVSLLNADNFNVNSWGAVSVVDNTKTAATLMGWLKAYPEKISSGYILGSTYAGITYNTKDDATSGMKNVQFFGLMPMTNKEKEAEYTCNGAKVSYLCAGAVRCVKNK